MIDFYNTRRVLARPDDTQYRVMKVWGTNGFLLKNVNMCKILFGQRKCLGINAGDSRDFYYHPLTTKTSWITEIFDKLQEADKA